MPEHLFPKITVVTPNYNQGRFLEQTINSVLNQNYPNLEYVIVDGGSTDNSVEIIQKYRDRLHFWISERDKGMYDAINKGFSHSTGDIMCWINSDDVLWEGALNYVAETFSSNPNIQWLQGLPTVIDEQGEIIFQRPPVFSKFFFYFKKHVDTFSFIQQESTFWSKKLWEKSGGKLNTEYTLASDFDLWMRFFDFETLYCSNKQLGAFRKRQDQQSSNQVLYLEEANQSIHQQFNRLSIVEKTVFYTAELLRKLYYRTRIIFFISFSNKIVAKLTGKPKVV